jgi:hypothetical protein
LCRRFGTLLSAKKVPEMDYWKTDEELPGLRACDLLVLRHDGDAPTLGVRRETKGESKEGV